ncbi:hypothetical protein CC80DRAFT_113005 [Byssothecium circinans]|uniref:Uncharacterized protein n=1 Tax=Byssothecium circinans TaxID=147558 RepID=A0A6A5TT13_9PLEO|nr:hypothetical protein CC80DRAFT_113005 [Byssothecium circinans]
MKSFFRQSCAGTVGGKHRHVPSRVRSDCTRAKPPIQTPYQSITTSATTAALVLRPVRLVVRGVAHAPSVTIARCCPRRSTPSSPSAIAAALFPARTFHRVIGEKSRRWPSTSEVAHEPTSSPSPLSSRLCSPHHHPRPHHHPANGSLTASAAVNCV